MTPPPIPENLSPPIKDLALRCLEQDTKDRPSATYRHGGSNLEK
jgi:hypothetical protein